MKIDLREGFSKNISFKGTNVPLKETTDIIVNKLSEDNHDMLGLNKDLLRKFLNIATSDSVFLFNDKMYSQVDGVCMGSCLGPTYANAFLCHFESIWLNDCPITFKPIYYKRYIDDTFLIFRDYSHVKMFLDYLNMKHHNIKFTFEIEENNSLSFLDTLITKKDGKLVSSIYRKPSFTGLGLKFLSFCPYLYKINTVKTLLSRAYKICSSYVSFSRELQFLSDFFKRNAYPDFIFDGILRRFLNEIFSPKPVILTAPKEKKYIKLPYLGNISFNIRKQLKNILRKSFPQIDFHFVFTNSLTIGSFLKPHMPRRLNITSCVVYLFECSSCNARYIGSTSRSLANRISNHIGVSERTRYPLSNPMYSAIREHSHAHDHPFTHSDFKVLISSFSRADLLILESLFISKMKPILNNSASAQQLYTH